jgi:hypothetical protein
MNHVLQKAINWKCPAEKVYEYTTDISSFCFHWYKPFQFLDSNAPYFEQLRPRYYLCRAHTTGNERCHTIQPAWKSGDGDEFLVVKDLITALQQDRRAPTKVMDSFSEPQRAG